jgi:hypothetical protein
MSSIFIDKTIEPSDKLLDEAIGNSHVLWQEIKSYIFKNYGETTEEWKYYGEKYGWTLKKILKKRNLFFLNPAKNFFNIAFVFGDRAVAVIEQSNLPSPIINEIKNARKYAEGRGINIEVRSNEDVNIIKQLLDIKISH